MAPQQNSTLIDENLDVCPPLINIPEEIGHYSPILPPKNKQNQNYDKNNNNNNKNDNGKLNEEDVDFLRNWKQQKEQQQEHRQAEMGKRHYHQQKYKHHRNGSIRSGHSRRSRSISLYGVNSTVEQGHKEITIWLGDEPRYVSGVTNKTTCNDIIKALIDDEIHCGNYDYCQRSEDGTASRDYSDYVITECWRGIERSYDGNMAILPVWKAWSRVHNEIRLSLKHHKDIQDPMKALKSNTTLSFIRNYICKLLRIGKRKPSQKPKPHKLSNNKGKEKHQQQGQEQIAVILMPHSNNDPVMKPKSSNLKPTKEKSCTQAKTKINKEKLYRLSESRSTQRKRRSMHKRKEKRTSHGNGANFDFNFNYLRRRKDSTVRSSLRNKLAQKNVEIDELYDREYALTRELTNKCKLYKLQNELYTKSGQDLEISVGQIQRNIEAYAKEIIRTEHALLEVKNEIKQDLSIVNNLKRLTLDSDPNECGVPVDDDKILKPGAEQVATVAPDDPSGYQMDFVDNIYEFCDNNASMLV